MIVRILLAILLLAAPCHATDWVDGHQFDEFEISAWNGLSSEPSVSSTDTARIYYNSTTDKLRLSVNGGAYSDLGAETDPVFTAWLGTSPLSGYVPYTGATTDVDLGGHNLTTTGTGTFGVVLIDTTADGSGSTLQMGGYGIAYGAKTPTTYDAATLSLYSASTYFKDINPTDMVGFTGYNLNATNDWLFKALYSSYATDNGFIFATKAVSGTWGSADGDITFKPADTTCLQLKAITQNVLVGGGADDTVNKLQVTGSAIATSWITSGGASTDFVKGDGSLDSSTYLTKTTRSIGIVIDGAGSVITTGVKGYFRCPYAGTIKSWSMAEITDTPVSTTTVIDVWKDTTANYPPTNADSITNGHEPTITATTNALDTDLSDWTSVAISAGDYIGYNVDSNNNAKKISLVLSVESAS